MARTVGIVALVAVALIAMSAMEADAHWTVSSGKLVYHSLDCESLLKNWDALGEAAEGRCLTTATVVEVECTNPQGKVVKGTASHPIVLPPAEGLVSTDSVTKKGKSFQAAGHLRLEILSDEEVPTLGLDPGEVCNNNWAVTGALIRKAILRVEIWPCAIVTGSDGRATCLIVNDEPVLLGFMESAQNFACTLSPEFTLDNPPTDGTAMSCVKDGPQEHLAP